MWPKAKHPVIMRLKHVRRAAKDVDTHAIIQTAFLLSTNPIRSRKASIEELRWMTYGVIGANYQGIIWRPGVGIIFETDPPYDVRTLEPEILQYASELGQAHPVSQWIKKSEGDDILVSAIRSKEDCNQRLFVIVLNPNYLQEVDGEWMSPTDPPVLQGSIRLMLPIEITASNAKSLVDGEPIEVKDGSFEYRFKGSGQIVVLDIAED